MKGKKGIMSASQAAKAAKKGTDMGSPGKGFSAGVDKLTPKYGKERAKKIMGAQFQNMRKKGQL
jgi:hypothetical protein